jgi:hypothetical protein
MVLREHATNTAGFTLRAQHVGAFYNRMCPIIFAKDMESNLTYIDNYELLLSMYEK